MNKRAWLVVSAVAMFLHSNGVWARALSDAEAAAWNRYVLPLPHEMAVRAVLELKPADVSVTLCSTNAGPAAEQGVAELRSLFEGKTGTVPEGETFEIRLGMVDDKGCVGGVAVPSASRLPELPNRDQAYVIEPLGETGLVVAALSGKGLYYGACTLRQLLEPNLTKEAVAVPLAFIVDWPDFEERGFWHMPLNRVPWLSTLKLNHFHSTTRFKVLEDEELELQISTYIDGNPEARKAWAVPYERARRYAAEVVPGILHFDFWECRFPGFAAAFPDLIGKGDNAKAMPKWHDRHQRVLCASNPELRSILQDLMTQLAALGAAEINVWQSEYSDAFCECDACMKAGQFQSEAKSSISAWQEVRKLYPSLPLRVFYGVGAGGKRYPDKAIAEVLELAMANGVKVGASGGVSSALLAGYVEKGGWLSRYAVIHMYSPWRRFVSSDFRRVVSRVKEVGCRGVCQFFPGFYRQDIQTVCGYQSSALAEYTWNVNGRTEREFAEAWAAQHGFNRPELFAECMTVLGTSEMLQLQKRMWACWDNSPFGHPGLDASWLGRLPGNLKDRKQDESLDPDVIEAADAACARALALVQPLEPRDLAWEVRCLAAYNELERKGYAFLERTTKLRAGENAEIEPALGGFQKALRGYVDAMKVKIDGWQVSPALEKSLKSGADELRKLSEAVANAVSGAAGG